MTQLFICTHVDKHKREGYPLPVFSQASNINGYALTSKVGHLTDAMGAFFVTEGYKRKCRTPPHISDGQYVVPGFLVAPRLGPGQSLHTRARHLHF